MTRGEYNRNITDRQFSPQNLHAKHSYMPSPISNLRMTSNDMLQSYIDSSVVSKLEQDLNKSQMQTSKFLSF